MAKTKGNPLQAALNAADDQDNAKPTKRRAAAKKATPERRITKGPKRNTVLIGGQFMPEVKQQLRLIAAEEDTTSQALLEEALNLLFVKKGKQAIL